jgi:hypothetical protein
VGASAVGKELCINPVNDIQQGIAEAACRFYLYNYTKPLSLGPGWNYARSHNDSTRLRG